MLFSRAEVRVLNARSSAPAAVEAIRRRRERVELQQAMNASPELLSAFRIWMGRAHRIHRCGDNAVLAMLALRYSLR